MELESTLIPLWIKLAYTLFVCVTVVIYARKYPLANFLWCSDITLVGTVAALWLESSLLASMMALSVLLLDVLWNVSFIVQLITGRGIPGLTDYMFDPESPRYVRALSLFHVFMPVLLVWMVIGVRLVAADHLQDFVVEFVVQRVQCLRPAQRDHDYAVELVHQHAAFELPIFGQRALRLRHARTLGRKALHDPLHLRDAEASHQIERAAPEAQRQPATQIEIRRLADATVEDVRAL